MIAAPRFETITRVNCVIWHCGSAVVLSAHAGRRVVVVVVVSWGETRATENRSNKRGFGRIFQFRYTALANTPEKIIRQDRPIAGRLIDRERIVEKFNCRDAAPSDPVETRKRTELNFAEWPQGQLRFPFPPLSFATHGETKTRVREEREREREREEERKTRRNASAGWTSNSVENRDNYGNS